MANSRVIKDKDKPLMQAAKKRKKTLTLESGKKVSLNGKPFTPRINPKIIQFGYL